MNRNSPEWTALRALVVAEIERLRLVLEQPGLDPAHIRGEIAALRWIIKQVEPDAPPVTKPPEQPLPRDY